MPAKCTSSSFYSPASATVLIQRLRLQFVEAENGQRRKILLHFLILKKKGEKIKKKISYKGIHKIFETKTWMNTEKLWSNHTNFFLVAIEKINK